MPEHGYHHRKGPFSSRHPLILRQWEPLEKGFHGKSSICSLPLQLPPYMLQTSIVNQPRKPLHRPWVLLGLYLVPSHIKSLTVSSSLLQPGAFQMCWSTASCFLPDSHAANIPLVSELGIDNIHFDDFSLDTDAMITAALRMFMELGMVQKFKIDYETLCRWLLTVRKNYRMVLYHNWRHAFNVCQLMFAMLTGPKDLRPPNIYKQFSEGSAMIVKEAKFKSRITQHNSSSCATKPDSIFYEKVHYNRDKKQFIGK
ncbi:Dual 3',5'-cyclic-AMP and -GMP phosphodiesterase 11A [Varanus komodoensis]|nr:Dual 3',5'-cyclic-AMP and -GMP phosphodiesterase 11A [Varanus komodoensis]